MFRLCYTAIDFGVVRLLEEFSSCRPLPALLTPSNVLEPRRSDLLTTGLRVRAADAVRQF